MEYSLLLMVRSITSLGNLNVRRDFGFSPDYVIAMWKMLQQDRPEDFLVVVVSLFLCVSLFCMSLVVCSCRCFAS